MRCYYCDESLQPGRHKCWSTGLSFDVGESGVRVAAVSSDCAPSTPSASFRGERLVASEVYSNDNNNVNSNNNIISSSSNDSPLFDSWSEIVGGHRSPQEILGELVARSPEFRQYAEKRAAISRLVSARPQKSRLWQLDFGPVSGAEGEERAIEVRPSALFRGEKILASDTGRVPGKGTHLLSLLVGGHSQFRPGAGPVSLDAFSNNSLGSGIKFDVCQPSDSIMMVVKFVESCTFDATIFGRVAL